MNKGKVAGNSPQIINLEQGKNYFWCKCGLSENQPWCNGAHKASEFTPVKFKVEESKKAAVCMCKQTDNPPFCDGSHKNI